MSGNLKWRLVSSCLSLPIPEPANKKLPKRQVCCHPSGWTTVHCCASTLLKASIKATLEDGWNESETQRQLRVF